MKDLNGENGDLRKWNFGIPDAVSISYCDFLVPQIFHPNHTLERVFWGEIMCKSPCLALVSPF